MKRYGLIGKRLSHSFSKSFFEDYFEKHAIHASYENLELEDLSEFTSLQNFDGFNVTIPYKESILPFLDEVDAKVQEIGAVNTIAIQEGRKIGYNTDVIGFSNSIKPFLTNRHERALILGTGGASKAVVYVLENLGIECALVSREEGKGDFIWSEMNELMVDAFKLIVNTTPVGMYPNQDELIDLPYQALTNEHLAIDLIYNPEETLFLKEARTKGATGLNGLSMLREQALASYQIWNG